MSTLAKVCFTQYVGFCEKLKDWFLFHKNKYIKNSKQNQNINSDYSIRKFYHKA